MSEPTTYTLTLKATGNGPPGIIRIKRALKYLLRACGLRCVEICEVADDAAENWIEPKTSGRAVAQYPTSRKDDDR